MEMTLKKRRSRSKAEQRAESLEQILNAAEYLFSLHGLHGVSLRDVADQVGVHKTLVNYYFKDKFSLFEAAFKRRVGLSIDRRTDALEKYQAEAGAKVTAEGALHAFLDTDLDIYLEGGDSWMYWGTFCAQMSNIREGAELMGDIFDPVVLKLIKVLKRALPNCTEKDLFWGFQFVSGALMHTLARTGRIDRLSGGLCRSDDLREAKMRIAAFMAGGFQALEKTGRKPKTRAAG
jgi:AcrR family transcriptional regulator